MSDVTIRLRDGLTYAVTVDPPVVPPVDPPVVTPPATGPLATIAPGTARQIGYYTPSGLKDGDYGARPAYSGFALDPASGDLMIIGNEHDQMGPNDILGFNETTLKWTSRSPITPKDDRTIANFDHDMNRFIKDGLYAPPHTYNASVVIGTKFIVATTGGGGRRAWYDFADPGKWSFSNHQPAYHYDGAACATPDGKVLYASGTKLYLWDVATDTEVQVATSPAIGVTLSLVYYPPNGKYYAISPNAPGAVRVVEITLSGTTATVTELTMTGPAPTGSGYVAMSYDSVNQTIGGMLGRGDWDVTGEYFAMKPTTKEWRKWVITDATGVKPACWFFAGKHLKSGVFIALSGWYHTPSQMTWAIRPPAWT